MTIYNNSSALITNEQHVNSFIQEMLIKKFNIINATTGTYNSNIVKESWFIKNGLTSELKIILKETEELIDRPFTERIRAFFNLPIHHCSECGKPTKIAGRKNWQKFCSKFCSNRNKEKREAGSQTFNLKSKEEKEKIQQCREESFKKKYGVIRNAERPEIREKIIDSIREHHALSKETENLLTSYEWLFEQYVIKEKTLIEIANDLGCHTSHIKNSLKKLKIPQRITPQLTQYQNELLYFSDEWLQKRYVKDSCSVNELAKSINTSRNRIINALNYHQIGIKNQYFYSIVDFMRDNKRWLEIQYLEKRKTSQQIANEIGVTKSTVLYILKFHGIEARHIHAISSYETEIVKFINDELKIDNVICSDKILLDGKEIDIYLPDYSVAIEINGLYWHSKKDINYHLDKTKILNNRGIKLIHFTDKQWIEQKEIVKSMIRNALQKNTIKIFARNCELKLVSNNQANDFFNKCHIQGSCKSYKIKIGLFYNEKLVALTAFSKPRFNKNYDWELLRFCTELNVSVVGGFSKMLKYFKSLYFGSIISYADYSRSNGNIYEKTGFTRKYITKPGYIWTNGTIVLNRYQTQKHKLEKLLGSEKYDHNLTETENMQQNGFNKFYDCGQLVYVL